jgi:putative transport protein
MHGLCAWLGEQKLLLLFVVVAAGYALGRVKIKGVGLGPTAATLLLGLALSLFAALQGARFNISELVSTIFFDLFMFAVGMKVGPQFLSGLRRDARKFIFLGLFIPVLSLGLMFLVRALFDLGPGMTPGIFAGGNTATPGLGAAQAAYSGGAMALPKGVALPEVLGNLSAAFAFSYCIGMTTFILLMKLPDLLGRDVVGQAAQFEAALKSGAPLPGSAEEFFGGPLPVAIRSYRVDKPGAVGHDLGELRRAYPLLAVERILRRDQRLDALDQVVVQSGDVVALYGRVDRLIAAGPRLGPEVDAPVDGRLGPETVDIIASRPDAVGRSLRDLAAGVGHGLYLNALFRGGEEVPTGPDTVVLKGDVVRVTGTRWRIDIAAKEIGQVVRPSLSTDIVTLALGLCLGLLIGLITIPIGHVRIAVGSAVGLLLVGITLSTLRTRYPALGGPYPEPARRLIEDLGLNVFIAVLAINSGAGVIKAISGGSLIPIVVGSLLVGAVPPVAGWLIGSRVLKMNDALLLGAVAGGRCNSAGMQVAQEVTHSTVPAIAYPVTFAISNVTLTIMTYLLAMLR